MIDATIMKRILLVLTAALLLTACRSPKPTSLAGDAGALAIRNNCYSLMHDLFNDEKDISILRFIRPEDTAIKNMTKTIAIASKTDEQKLEAMAKEDPSIRLYAMDLPPGEVKTRDAISKTKEHDLLTRKGRQFNVALLLTQTEALNYGRHLALVCARYEPDPARARALMNISDQMLNLYTQVYDMLLAEQAKG